MNVIRSLKTPLSHRYSIFIVFFLLLGVYCLFFGDAIIRAINYPNILIAPIMTLGSFVAGSTFLGGGAIAFPALTKILQSDPETAKTFSFAIQSVGMSAAALYIISRVKSLPLSFIGIYTIGSLCGLGLCLSFLQNLFTSSDIRIGFTLFVLCFLIIYLWTQKQYRADKNEYTTLALNTLHTRPSHVALTLTCGMLGGLISGLIGSGADLMGFCLLVLYFRTDLKLATQTSVIVMAIVSIAGISLQGLVFDAVNDQVVSLWYIAAPIVLFGAPLGAVFCKHTSTGKLIGFISLIVLIEVISTIILVELEVKRALFYAFSFASALVFLSLLFRLSPHHIHLDKDPK